MEQNGLFAHVNDSIRKVANESSAAQTWEFVCECADLTCHELVSLTLVEFDERRAASPPVPVVVSDHGG